MKKAYINPKAKTIDFSLEQHILQTSTKDTIINNNTEVGAEESLTRGYKGRKDGIWD